MTVDTKVSRSVDTLYTVKAGESLSSIAQAWYGDAQRATDIANKNNIALQSILYIGQRLILPAFEPTTTLPASPGGSVPVSYDGQLIETVTTTASVWYKDWRYWLAIGGAMGLLLFLAGRKSRR